MCSAPSRDPLEALHAQQAMASAPPLESAHLPIPEASMQDSLIQLGVPWGLARLIGEEDKHIGLRIFILDNSGSTSTMDGKYLTQSSRGNATWTPCTRWEEIRRMAKEQAAWNASTGVPCEFILLNSPSGSALGGWREGMDFAVVNPQQGDIQGQLNNLYRMLDSAIPRGATPISERLCEVQRRIQNVHGRSLVCQGKRIVVVLATDGLPTSSSNVPTADAKVELVNNLRQMCQQLPVFVVIRLCTDEDNVVAYYNQIDEEEELPLEVIDDCCGEAQEAANSGNAWLTYSPLIHKIREGGTFVKLFDLLDERKLTPLEVRLFVGHLLQREDEEPLAMGKRREFMRKAQERLSKMPEVYDARRRRMAPCMNLNLVRRAIRPPGCCCWS